MRYLTVQLQFTAYRTQCPVKDVVNLFQQMQNAGFHPHHIALLALLSACVHTSQVEEGFQLFHCMTEEYGIAAWMEHYASMVYI